MIRASRYLLALTGILLALWLAGVMLSDNSEQLIVDGRSGVVIPKPGTSVWHFTEGFGTTQFGDYGRNPVALDLADGCSNTIYLYGDSFVEAYHVRDDKKPDVVLTQRLRHRLGSDDWAAIGFGGSGRSLKDMIRAAHDAERLMGVPKAHVFLSCGLQDDLFTHGGRFKPTGRIESFLYQWRLNFLCVAKRKIFGLFRQNGTSLSGTKKAEERDLHLALQEVRADLATLQAPSTVFYLPSVPRLADGQVNLSDEEYARTGDDLMIDLSADAVRHYRATNKFVRGFPNLGGPGHGHLNEGGIVCVMDAIARELILRGGGYDL